MLAANKKQLQKNIVKYSWYKIFTKRVYLPLITIQLFNVGKVTVEEIAIIAIVTSLVMGLLQLPAGYFADRYGNKKSIVIGCLISVWSPLFYAFMPNFWGGLIASVLFFGGYAFQSGAIEAFIHNTLVALKQENDYSKVLGRAQTYGLIGNVVLLAAVPATYAIHHTLPFLLGFLSLAIMTGLVISFVEPSTAKYKAGRNDPFLAVRAVLTGKNIALFVFAGFMTGVAYKSGEFRELAMQDIGVAVSLLGIIVAASSLLGAILGWYVHLLDRLRPMHFYLFDVLFISASLICMGITDSIPFTVGAYILFMAYVRVRMIVFQSKLLHDIRHIYKATLLSALSLFTLVSELVVITMLGRFVGLKGFQEGYVLFGSVVLAVGLAMWLFLVVRPRLVRPA